MRFELKPLSFGEVLDGSFKIYRNNVGLFLTAAVLFDLPSILISSWTRAAQYGLPRGQLPPGFWPMTLLAMVGAIFVWGALTAAAVSVVLGEPTSLGKISRRFVAVLGRSIVASIVVAFIGTLCTVALVVPGIVYFLRRSLYLPVLLVEGTPALDALKRSRALVKGTTREGGRMGRLFGASLIFGVLSWALIGGIGMLVPASLKGTFVGALVSVLPQVLILPLFPISLVLIYFDARVRDEGYDLEVRAQQAADPTAPPSPAAAGPA